MTDYLDSIYKKETYNDVKKSAIATVIPFLEKEKDKVVEKKKTSTKKCTKKKISYVSTKDPIPTITPGKSANKKVYNSVCNGSKRPTGEDRSKASFTSNSKARREALQKP